MNTTTRNIKKSVIAGFLAVALFATFAPQTHAQTYYYSTGQAQTTAQMQALIAQLQSLLVQLKQRAHNQQQNQYYYYYPPQYQNNYGNYYNNHNRYNDIEIDTLSTRNIGRYEATLYGRVDLNDASYARVWFEYGTNGRFNQSTNKIRVTNNVNFHIDVDDLNASRKYYVRAVAEDPVGHRTYGNIATFTTDYSSNHNNNYGDEPDAQTSAARNITDDRAKLRGTIDMNDFDDGLVFFVWGTTRSYVDNVDSKNRYNAINERGDRLQKYRVYDNLNGYRSFWLEVAGLNDDTDYYYRICVQYEGDRGNDTLECGDVDNFQTDY